MPGIVETRGGGGGEGGREGGRERRWEMRLVFEREEVRGRKTSDRAEVSPSLRRAASRRSCRTRAVSGPLLPFIELPAPGER